MTFAGAAGTHDQYRDFFFDEAARSQVMDRRAVQIGQPVEVETFQRLLMLPPGHFVMDQQTEEIGEGQLAIDGFAVAGFQRFLNARQAQVFEQGCEFGNRMHGRPH